MGTPAPAEELPGLYRAILDRVAELEASGRRREAGRIRREAAKSYSRAWDDRARRQLTDLLRSATRAVEPPARRGSSAPAVPNGLARSPQAVAPER